MAKMLGTAKQVAWVEGQILPKLRQRFKGRALPDILSAPFWIRHKDDTSIQSILDDARNWQPDHVQDRFIKHFPQSGSDQAIASLALVGDFAVIDCETDGKDKAADVIDVAVVSSKSEVLFSRLIKPLKVDALDGSEASRVNGITADMLTDAPHLKDVWPELQAAMTTYRLFAYNAKFDGPMIRNSAQRQGIPAPAFDVTCAMELAQAYFSLDYYPKLDEALTLAGLSRKENETQHRALGDALVTVRLMQTLRGAARQGLTDPRDIQRKGKVDTIASSLKYHVNVYTSDLNEEWDGQLVVVGGLIADVQHASTGGVTAIRIQDMRGFLDVHIPGALQTDALWREDTPILVTGEVRMSGDTPYVYCESAEKFIPASRLEEVAHTLECPRCTRYFTVEREGAWLLGPSGEECWMSAYGPAWNYSVDGLLYCSRLCLTQVSEKEHQRL